MKNLSKAALFDKLAFNAAMILVCLILLALALQKAPISMGYIKIALINGGICALIIFLFYRKEFSCGNMDNFSSDCLLWSSKSPLF